MTKNNAPQQSVLARTARGAGWVIGWRMTTRLIGMASTLILARLLVPADFGLVALANIFAGTVEAFSTVGVEQALIRAPCPDRDLYDTGFTINLLRGLLTAALIALFAHPLAAFYGDLRLAPLLYLLAAATAADGLENIGIIEFRRNLIFDKEFRLKVFPRLLSVVVTIACALAWRSYWALMAGILAGRLFLLAQGYVMHPFRPRISLRRWREIAAYSFWVWLTALVWTIHDRVGNLAIGRVVGPASLGVFMIGGEVAGLPSSELVLPLTRACFPGFAAIRQEGGNSGKAFLRIVGVMMVLSLPAGIGLALVAAPLIRLGFGAQWMAAVPVMRILALAGTLGVFASIGSTLLSAHAHLRPLFLLSLGSVVVKLPLLVVLGERYNIVGVAVAVGATTIGEHLVNIGIVMRRYRISFAALAGAVWRPVLATAAMAAVLGLSGLGWSAPPAPAGPLAAALFAAAALGALVYGAALFALWAGCGKPAGAEVDVLDLAARMFGRLRGLLPRLTAARR